MTTFAIDKVLSTLPGTLVANTVYLVRVGTGIDIYATDSTGSIAYKQNGSPAGLPMQPAQTGDYTFTLDDANKCVPYSHSSTPGTFTVPSNTTVDYEIGTQIFVRQGLNAPVTIAGSFGVTVEGWGGFTDTVGQHDYLVLTKVFANAWTVTPLHAARLYPGAKINGVLFTGSSNIDLRYTVVSDGLFAGAVTLSDTLSTVLLTADLSTITTYASPAGYGQTIAVRFAQDATGGVERDVPRELQVCGGL